MRKHKIEDFIMMLASNILLGCSVAFILGSISINWNLLTELNEKDKKQKSKALWSY